ncbi:MAG TPA: hypothetical protein DD459_05375 [Halieaceae bacterium]|nr:hypothetical protein [Halieaceae bacterium]
MLAEIHKRRERVPCPADTMRTQKDFTVFIFRNSTVPCYFGVKDYARWGACVPAGTDRTAEPFAYVV